MGLKFYWNTPRRFLQVQDFKFLSGKSKKDKSNWERKRGGLKKVKVAFSEKVKKEFFLWMNRLNILYVNRGQHEVAREWESVRERVEASHYSMIYSHKRKLNLLARQQMFLVEKKKKRENCFKNFLT